jgi:NAD-dependent deacetylase
MSDPAQRLADALAPARRIVAFTGAGISTESGIPDFRSPGGVWSRMRPTPFKDFVGDEAVRRESWRRTFSGVARWTGASPNAGHLAVARLVQAGRISAIITQNIDNLHQAAGAPADQVIELHGNAGHAACLDCGLRHELEDLRGPFEQQGRIPACRACNGIVKTAVISFGQALPPAAWRRAEDETRACDLFLVLGSSLTVRPAANLPRLAWEAGVPVVIVNRDATPLDHLATLVLRETIGPLLTEAVGRLAAND